MDLTFYQNKINLSYYINLKKYNTDSTVEKVINEKISKIQIILKETNDSVNEEKILILESKLSETEEGYFYKPWNKMSLVHKIIKLKEYVSDLELENNTKIKLISYLKDALKKKKITKNDQVIYNISKAKIISIPKLELSNNKFSIC
tara:strand:- start:2463 stop:2903 length:441 start_codon:yes stop_codon:yes gene_type:complete